VVATIKDVDTVITGHIPTPTTWNELKEYADFTQDFVTWAQTEMKAGKTVDQAVPEYKVPAKYRATFPARTRSSWREIQPGGSLQGAEEVAADKTSCLRVVRNAGKSSRHR